MKGLNAEIAVLETEFRQNILSEVNDLSIVVDSREELAGLSESRIDAASKEAADRGREGQFVIPLLNTSGQPTLAQLQNRDLRERIHKASLSRGHRGGEFDNRGVLSAVLEKRAARAKLLGYENHAEYTLENQTALTVEAVNERLSQLAAAALINVSEELASLQDMITNDEQDFELASWDWDFYSERLRAQRFDFDADDLSPYLELNSVLQRGVFYAAENLFGITFQERFDLPVYQDDVRVFEVYDVNGETLALFIADFYARPSKRGGAWMNAYISQSHLLGTKPVIANHLNITKPTSGQPTLLTFDEVTTMFHEFGHALHGMFSSVEFPSFSGTRVPRDFVEFPSQVNEMWAIWPKVLKNYAVHHRTGESMPAELLDKVLATQTFNQGFSTLEYLSASIIDQALHQLDQEDIPSAAEIMNFESNTLKEFGLMLPSVPPRYRSTYFSHIMGGYSAGYYSYIWSEVLDADTVNWFKENGGLSQSNGDRFRAKLLSKGGSKDAMTLYRDFAGRDASIGPLLDRRGLK
jgi:peptidyl-dipeptidase Dcp